MYCAEIRLRFRSPTCTIYSTVTVVSLCRVTVLLVSRILLVLLVDLQYKTRLKDAARAAGRRALEHVGPAAGELQKSNLAAGSLPTELPTWSPHAIHA